MAEVTKQQKEELLKAHGIVYQANSGLDDLYKLAMVKDLLVAKDNECFGAFIEADEECKKCYLGKGTHCQRLTKHLLTYGAERWKSNDILRIPRMDGTGLDDIGIARELERCGMKSTATKTYKVAALVLRSNDRPLNEVLKEICIIVGDNCPKTHAHVYLSQVIKRINQYSEIKIYRERVSFLRISRKIRS